MEDYIKKIISEEIQKVYEETDILTSFPELKEATLKFNRLVDEGFEDIQKIYDKTFKYNTSDIENMQKDKGVVDEFVKEIEEIKNTFSGFAYESANISDDEQIEVENMLETVKKYSYSISSLSDVIGKTINNYQSLMEELGQIRAGNAPLHDKNNFKIFVN